MPRLIPVLAVSLTLAAGGLAVAGCGSDDSSSSTSTAAPAAAATTPATSTPTAGASADGKTVAISMKNIAFDPKETTVNVGEKVVWTNDDTVQHNVVADSGATFKSDIFGNGDTYEYTPEKAGTITYVCTLHPGMAGTLKVIG